MPVVYYFEYVASKKMVSRMKMYHSKRGWDVFGLDCESKNWFFITTLKEEGEKCEQISYNRDYILQLIGILFEFLEKGHQFPKHIGIKGNGNVHVVSVLRPADHCSEEQRLLDRKDHKLEGVAIGAAV